jgi:predicted NAD/FAD-binding protein
MLINNVNDMDGFQKRCTCAGASQKNNREIEVGKAAEQSGRRDAHNLKISLCLFQANSDCPCLPMESDLSMRIAIIGAGISGNLIARLLCQEHDIEVFEAAHRVGGHTRTLRVAPFGKEYLVDTGFMVFNERTYPNFSRLLHLLEVPAHNTDMSFSVRCDATGLEYEGGSLNGLFAQRRNLVRPAFLGMLRDLIRFNRAALSFLEEDLSGVSLRDILSRGRFGGWFVDKYLLPMSAAIWSCPPGRVLDFPAHAMLVFLRNHGFLQVWDRPQWKTVVGSARRYVEELIRPYRDRIRSDSPVTSVRRFQDHVVVRTGQHPAEAFDSVILACHADQALALLEDADPAESEVLRAFPYQTNQAVLHTDTGLLPQRRRAWASWNYHVFDQAERPVAVTYDLSRLQDLDTPSPILLTLNCEDRVDPAKILDRCVFEHPVFTRDSPAAQQRFAEINGPRRTYFCGAYWGNGFHEDGVNSALAVAKYFGLGFNTWKAASTKASFTTSV